MANILNPESEIVIFFGPRGTGKSSLMAHFVDEYLKTQADKRWEQSKQIIREENISRQTPLYFPDKPPIYSNTKYKLKTRDGTEFEPFPIKGCEIGVNREENDDNNVYKYLFPVPLIALDEAHNEFCSKGEPKLPPGQFEFIMECRHDLIIMLLAAPRAVLINKDIRASGSRFIEPRSFKHERDSFGRVFKTTWYCREFLETSAIEEYISTNGKSNDYIETTYTHNGDVRKLYNGFAYRHRFIPPEGKNFET